ncbi:DUF429 domain-containing protein [Haloplanus natans]|uniref:DUF429 domain-containing protein n=1 Tax=Haloplanus natans TaxID=376171 RepID=UPI00146FB533|nr:DUF429 domain-containing protein [Haloplanus natans]
MSITVYGIDFSGSKSPGQKIWITEASMTGTPDNHLQVETVQSAADRFEATYRDEILAALRDLIRRTETAVFGLDFPFSLPQSTTGVDHWDEFLHRFANTFAGEEVEAYPGAYASNGRSKRETDFRFGGQSPMSPQVQYQVFYGLRDVLHPLVADDAVRVVPMQRRDPMKPTLLEVYPAATFGVERLYRTGYKDNSQQSRRRRRVNAEGLQAHEKMSIKDEDVERASHSDDALDSLCAAFAVRRALSDGVAREGRAIEGHIYA